MELFLIAIAYVIGIILGLYFKLIGIVFFVCLIFVIILFRKNRYIRLFFNRKYLLIFIIFFLISYLRILYLENDSEQKYKDTPEESNIVGTIVQDGEEKQYSTKYVLKVESINNNYSYKNTQLILYVKKDKNFKKYKYGNKISLDGEFNLPNTARNTGGFNYKEYLKTKNIYWIVNTESNNIKIQKEKNIDFLNDSINNISTKVKENIDNLFDKNSAQLLKAMLIGDKEDLEDDIIDTFRKSNLSHILAISGMHVSYIIMGIGFLINKIKIGKIKGKIITILFLIFFMLLTGNSPSVTRACIMSCYIILASLLHKRVNTFYALNISMIILLVINPYYMFDIGFQLSYSGTFGILLFHKTLSKILNKNKSKIKDILIVTLSANIVILPIILYHFNTLSLSFLISNLCVTPFIGIIMILGFITIIISLIFFPFAKILSFILKILINLFLKIVTITSNLPLSQIYIPTPKIYTIVIYYLIIFTILIIYKIKQKKIKRKIEIKILNSLKIINKKILIIVIVIISVLTYIYNQIPKDLNIYFIDVGQGDSSLIVTPNRKTILIDGGGIENKESFDVGEDTLIPYLLDRGIVNLDYIMISHFDTDHVGGILSIIEKLNVNQIIICKQEKSSENYEKFKELVNKKKIKVEIVKKR